MLYGYFPKVFCRFKGFNSFIKSEISTIYILFIFFLRLLNDTNVYLDRCNVKFKTHTNRILITITVYLFISVSNTVSTVYMYDSYCGLKLLFK